MLKSRNMLIFGYIWDFRGWWRHQMTPKFQKRWNLPKIVKTNLKTFEKMYNTTNLNDFWFSWLWRHNDVTITSRSRFPIGLLVFFEIECRKEQCVKVSFQYPQGAVCHAFLTVTDPTSNENNKTLFHGKLVKAVWITAITQYGSK